MAFGPWIDPEISMERERKELIAQLREGNGLKKEQRLLNLQMAQAEKEARMQIRQARAETMARQAEQMEMIQLVGELRSLVKAKETFLSQEEALPDSPQSASSEARRQHEQMLWEEHAAVQRRMQVTCETKKPQRTMPGAAMVDPDTPGRVTPRLRQMERIKRKQSMLPLGGAGQVASAVDLRAPRPISSSSISSSGTSAGGVPIVPLRSFNTFVPGLPPARATGGGGGEDAPAAAAAGSAAMLAA